MEGFLLTKRLNYYLQFTKGERNVPDEEDATATEPEVVEDDSDVTTDDLDLSQLEELEEE